MLTHVVLFTLSDPSDTAEAIERLRALDGQIPELLSLRVGTDTTDNPAASHIALISEHADAAGLRGYQEHPVHQELLAWLRPRLAGRAVVDSSDL